MCWFHFRPRNDDCDSLKSFQLWLALQREWKFRRHRTNWKHQHDMIQRADNAIHPTAQSRITSWKVLNGKGARLISYSCYKIKQNIASRRITERSSNNSTKAKPPARSFPSHATAEVLAQTLLHYHRHTLCPFDFCDKFKVSLANFPIVNFFPQLICLSSLSGLIGLILTLAFPCFPFREKELWHNKASGPTTHQQIYRNYLQDNDASKAEALESYDVSLLRRKKIRDW